MLALVLLFAGAGAGWGWWSWGWPEARRWTAPTDYLLMARILPDGKRAVVAERWGKVGLLDLQTLRPVGAAMDLDVRRVVVCGDGRTAVLCVPEAFDAGEMARLELWDLATGGRSKYFELGIRESWLSPPLAVSHDGSRVLCCNQDELVFFEAAGVVRAGHAPPLQEAAAVGVVRRITGAGMESLTHLAMSSDGRRAVGGGGDGVCRVWDLEKGIETGSVALHTAPITALVISPEGWCVVSADRAGTACVWDLAAGKVLARFSSGSQPFTALAASNGAARVLTGDAAGRVCLWDGRSGKCLARFAWHTGPILSVGFSPDGGQAISASEDGTVRFWNLPRGSRVGAQE